MSLNLKICDLKISGTGLAMLRSRSQFPEDQIFK